LAFASNATGFEPTPGDYDADGAIDGAIRRISDGVWFINGSVIPFDGMIRQLGQGGDIPVSTAYPIE
jgi:hypothetical protein